MTIYYRDSAGVIMAKIDEYGIQFLDGKAYFSIDEKAERKIPIENIMQITAD